MNFDRPENIEMPNKSVDNDAQVDVEKQEDLLTIEQVNEISELLGIEGKNERDTEEMVERKADEFLESEPIKSLKEKKPGLIQKLAGSKFLKIAALTGSLLMAEVGSSQEIYGQEKKDKTEQRDEKSFEDNDIMQESLKSWLHFVKTNEYVEKDDISIVDSKIISELTRKYGNDNVGYKKALNEIKEKMYLKNNEIDENFQEKTDDVSLEELKKAYELLETKMDVWNVSKLSSFSSKLWLLNEMKNEGIDFSKFTKQPDKYPDWALSNVELNKDYEENAKNNAINLYLELKELLEQENSEK